ncbi:MAG: hypothetical protein JWN85_4822 [Gammaproteobacteria bacterium]|nr:hypothetical protein [Gammaproteobacteria bacterium]
MKSIWITAAALTAAIAINGCKHRHDEPVPGPKSPAATSRAPGTESRPDVSGEAKSSVSRRQGGASGISWFQGNVEEAFSTNCAKCTAMFWR